MFKRSESKTESSRRDRKKRPNRKRRMMMEDLESRRLLAGLGTPSGIELPVFNGPRNIGTVQAEIVLESELPNEAGLNDSLFNADLVPLGTLPGQEDTIDLIGNIGFIPSGTFPPTFRADVDTFAFDLRAGDILDIASQGAAGEYTVFTPDGQVWYGVDGLQSIGYPADSPLQTLGNAAFAQVIPEDGRYYVSIAPVTTGSQYTLGLRVYRPSIESTPVGTRQILYVDFDGGIYPRSVFDDGSGIPQPGIIRIPGLRESLPNLGIQIQDDASFNRLIDLTIAETKRMFEFLGTSTNGDFDSTLNPGDFGFTVLNSRDHPDPGTSDPLVTRILVGGTVDDSEIDTIGISSTIDVGNFSMDDIVLGLLDGVLDIATDIDIAPTSSIIEVMGDFLAFLVAHEAGHSFGMRHTSGRNAPQPFPENQVPNIMDEGPTSEFAETVGVGPDFIYGTIDDVDVNFVTDVWSYLEGLEGINFTKDSLANTLGTGTQQGGLTGRVFADVNGDGNSTGDSGLFGITIFSDLDNDGIRDPTEPFATSNDTGNYALTAVPGSYNVIATTPPDFAPTTPTTVPVTIAVGGPTVNVDFGFRSVVGGSTGSSFSDNNGNGLLDAGETGVPDIFHYIDLDGDNVPDVHEPNDVSRSDGTYNLDFPGPGTYTIRQVVPPGFTQTFPTSGEHTFFFNGISLPDSFNFGLLPSRDFGDAPDTYGTTLAVGGASHGITDSLSIGAVVDRELDGQPSGAADADDINGRILVSGATEDDEDGVRLLDPLGPGASATFEVTVTNNSGSNAFLQGFMDFNRDGDFDDVGEQFLTDLIVPTGSTGSVLNAEVAVPATATAGTTYARFRLSQTSGLGPRGSANSGEVEDYAFPILGSAQITNPDEFSVSRNSQANPLDVLSNDFETVDNQLTIQTLNTNGTDGIVILAGDRRSVFYTPPNGFIGRDAFTYTAVDEFGNSSTSTAVVNVTFQSAVPIAIDDTFELPQGSVNRALNVLDNDIPSTAGGLSIISVTPGSAGGTITIVGGGQSLRYTPLPGFNGTEQFTYSVQDSVGLTSSAEVTLNLLPGSRGDDVVEFTIDIFDPVNVNQEITNVQVGDEFLVRVSVEQIGGFSGTTGVASAFLDLLYTDELITTLNTDNNPDFPFDISFGPLFSGNGVLQRGSSQVPGVIDEVGGVQQIGNAVPHNNPVELFTLRMEAVSPGVALFTADPADAAVSETITIGSDTALEVRQLRLGTAELLISPAAGDFTSAIDDSFPDGRDSLGNLITSSAVDRNRLDVLANDNLGPTGTIREFGLVTNPSLGNVLIDDNGTPSDLNDDFLTYRPNGNANGLESFTYLIVTDDGIRSTAEVTFPLGNNNDAADVAFDFALVNENGVPITNSQVNVGDRFGVQVSVEDLRNIPTFVFAGFLDMMYDTGIVQPSNTNFGDVLDFDVAFGDDYRASAAVGTAARPGIIDEFGTLFDRATVPDIEFPSLNPGVLATVFFDAVAPGQTRVVGGPADSSPFQDTLLFESDDPVPVSDIRYDVLSITVNPAGSGALPLQNQANPMDVNNDGVVTPIDALLVINDMGRIPVEEGESSSSNLSSGYFLDVNGDQRVSAVDALRVINHLSVVRAQNTAQAEAVVAPAGSSPTSLQSDVQADAVFADLNDRDLAADAPGTADTVASQESVAAADDDSEEEDDDVINLLASDVSGLWF